MSDQTVLQTLQSISCFKEMPQEDLQKCASIARFIDFPANTLMFRELQPARDLYVIVKGSVSLVIFEPGLDYRELDRVGAGDLVGWSVIVGRSQLSDTARTLEPVTAIAIDGEGLLSVCSEDPRFGFKFMQVLARVLSQRLNAMRSLLIQKCGSNLPKSPLESD